MGGHLYTGGPPLARRARALPRPSIAATLLVEAQDRVLREPCGAALERLPPVPSPTPSPTETRHVTAPICPRDGPPTRPRFLVSSVSSPRERPRQAAGPLGESVVLKSSATWLRLNRSHQQGCSTTYTTTARSPVVCKGSDPRNPRNCHASARGPDFYGPPAPT